MIHAYHIASPKQSGLGRIAPCGGGSLSSLCAVRLASLSRKLSPVLSRVEGLPGTSVVSQWGGLVFKIADKAFLVLGLEAETLDGVVFKCTPEEFDELTEIDGIEQAPYFAKRHWVRVGDLAALSADELERRIRRSYDLVVAKLPKKTQATLKG